MAVLVASLGAAVAIVDHAASRDTAFAIGGFGEPVRATLGEDGVGMVQEPVDGGCGQGFEGEPGHPESGVDSGVSECCDEA